MTDYERGVWDAVAVLHDRGLRVGGVVSVRSTEIEIREKLFGELPAPRPDLAKR